MSTATGAPVKAPPSGRAIFWSGLGVCLLGVALMVAQYVLLKWLIVPWYFPALITIGAGLLLWSLARRRSVVRAIALLLVAALATFQWYALAVLMKVPAYEGPARAGQAIPAFETNLAGGRSFTEADLKSGSPTVLAFFRGRW
jgi:hypothetical protein